MRIFLVFAIMMILAAATSSHAKWFGKRDVREDPESFLNAKEQMHYSGVGRIECPADKVQKVAGTKINLIDKATGWPVIEKIAFSSTAFHVGSFSLLVTNSHAFTEDYLDVKTGRLRERLVDPKTCVAVFYDYTTGKETEVIKIKEARIRWAEHELFNDNSNDFAVVKLIHESRTTSSALAYDTRFGDNAATIDNQKVTVVGYHGDVNRPTVMRKTTGVIYRARRGYNGELFAARKGYPLKRLDGVILGNYAASHGVSGSPIINPEGVVIGIHQGQADLKDANLGHIFNRHNNYNQGILLDSKFHQDVQRMK